MQGYQHLPKILSFRPLRRIAPLEKSDQVSNLFFFCLFFFSEEPYSMWLCGVQDTFDSTVKSIVVNFWETLLAVPSEGHIL